MLFGANSAFGLVPPFGTNPVFSPVGGGAVSAGVVLPPDAPPTSSGHRRSMVTSGSGALVPILLLKVCRFLAHFLFPTLEVVVRSALVWYNPQTPLPPLLASPFDHWLAYINEQ